MPSSVLPCLSRSKFHRQFPPGDSNYLTVTTRTSSQSPMPHSLLVPLELIQPSESCSIGTAGKVAFEGLLMFGHVRSASSESLIVRDLLH